MKLNLRFLTTIGLCLSQYALAGWTSGGGHLRQADDNPWFIQNTSEVSYCIKIDEANFGTSKPMVAAKIKDSLEYWQRQFATFNLEALKAETEGDFYLNLGTQKFTEVECTDNVDIIFQFGVLQEAQAHYLKDPPSIIGIAVRTEYDEKTLKGKGFIYVSPTKGPLALRDARTSLWNEGDGKILHMVLTHELGHLFGIPHGGTREKLMSSQFPEFAVGEGGIQYVQKNLIIPDFFVGKYHGVTEMCLKYPDWLKLNSLFGIPDDFGCYKIIFNNETSVTLFAKEKSGSAYIRVTSPAPKAFYLSENGTDDLYEFYLPIKQEVFSKADSGLNLAYQRKDYQYFGTWVINGTDTQIAFALRRSFDRIEVDVAAESPIIPGVPIVPYLRLDLWNPIFREK